MELSRADPLTQTDSQTRDTQEGSKMAHTDREREGEREGGREREREREAPAGQLAGWPASLIN